MSYRQTLRVRLGRYLESDRASKVLGVVVILNAIMIGYQVDYPGGSFLTGTFLSLCLFYDLVLENMFVGIYTVECIARIYTQRLSYFRSPFNVVDFTIVCVSIADTWVLSHLGQTSNLNMVRVVRLLRLLRIIRLVRLLRFFKELMSAFRALTLSISSVAWMGLLVLLFTYVYSMIFNIILEYTLSSSTDAFPEFDQYFGHKVYKTSFTLFQIGSGYSCEGFPNIVRPLLKISNHPTLSFFLIAVYLIVFRYGFLTALVGVFVQSVSENEQIKRDQRREIDIENWTKSANRICLFFTTCHLIVDNDSAICLDDFQIACDHPYVIRYLRELGLNLYSPILLFNLLDYEKFRRIPVSSLVSRLVDLRKGGPSHFALHGILQQMAEIRAIFSRSSDRLAAIEYTSIDAQITQLESDIQGWIKRKGTWTQKQRLNGKIIRQLGHN